ncbi:unnamed protein product [Dovyalis caffra]|uniref:Uncharacterized protein n=1 Tax=Dovyalis caffra TaxID=77055 RepID=A0AAV1R814_9ROSI|nr:unnamed protein product [Dovyalis caffra]
MADNLSSRRARSPANPHAKQNSRTAKEPSFRKRDLAMSVAKPPPPNICGLPGGPPVTSPRIKLGDGRYLAYRERGVAQREI